jgi:hypothetical protein
MIFRSVVTLDEFKLSSTDIEQGADALGIDAQAVGDQRVIGSESSQAKAYSI